MSTPYSTPSFPAAPRPTPTSSRAQKAPIYNPYDKFTQNEFDTWIGGITGALRRALGQEGDEEEQESVTRNVAADLFASRDDDEAEQSPEYEPAETSEAEDSFEEVTTRLDKGKGRDPREGPGLGGRHQPIEILYSDSDEEESEGEEEIGDDEVDDEGEYDWREYDSDGNRHDEYEGSGDEYGEEASGHRDKDDSPEIIELSSEGEEEEEEGENQGPLEDGDVSDSPGAEARYMLSTAKFGQPPLPQDEDEDALGEEAGDYSMEQEEDVDEQAFPPRRSQSQSLDLADPWVGPQTYAEDFYSGGDIPEGVLDPTLVSPSNLTPVRAQSEHTWEDDANGLLPGTSPRSGEEPSIIDVDMDEDEKDEDLLNESSSVISSPVEEYNPHQGGYVEGEEEYDENYEFRDDQAFDQFLGEEAEGERQTDADSTTSPEIFIAAQPQTTQADTTKASSLVTYDRSPSATPVPNGHVDRNFPPVSPAVNDTPGPAAKSPASGAPDIIELSDNDDEEGSGHDDDEKDNIEEEVEELISEDEDEEPMGTTSDLIRDFIPEGEENVITTQEIRGEDIGRNDDAAIVKPFAFGPKEDVGVQSHNGDGEISAKHESAVRDVTNSPEVFDVDNFEENATKETHEVPADLRFKASLLESFLANADTTAEPVWHGGTLDLFMNLEQPSISNDTTVQSNGLGDSIVPSIVAAFSEEFAVAASDASAEHPTESLSGDKAARSASPQLSQEGPDVLQESNESITAEAHSQAGAHYTVSEVMDDDGRPSTAPDDIDVDVVSVADAQVGVSVPYIVEEPESESRLTEEPIDQDATVDVSMESSRLSYEDDGSSSPTANHMLNVTVAEPMEVSPITPDEIHSDPRNLPGVTPATAGIADSLAPGVSQPGELPVSGWEERDDEARTLPAFPMPISANPSVPDPAGISCTPDTHSTPPDLSRGFVAPQGSAQALHDPTEHTTEPSLKKPFFFMGTSVEQESLLNMNASGLFTPQNEAASAPVSPGPQADAIDNALTSVAEPDPLTPLSAKYSSVPLEIKDEMDDSNNEGLGLDTTDAASAQLCHPAPPSEEAKPLRAIEDEDDPFKLMGNDSEVAPGAVDDRPGSSEGQDEQIDDVQQLSPEILDGEAISNLHTINGTGTQVDKDQVATVTATSFYQNGAGQNGADHLSNGSRQNNNLDSVKDQQKKTPKRKRIAPLSIPARLTRSMSSKTSPVIDRKGKAKAEESTPSENGSSSSGASVASRMLRGASHDTSRASSVVSTAHSVESAAFSMQQSPTLARQSRNFKPDPPILYHVHSGIHHHHSRPSAVPRLSQTQKHPVASSSQSENVPTQSSPSHPSPSQRTAVAHSPVTRSNCRFHRISLPREEGGPRVAFIVPGCSIGDMALMEEEDIHDEGDATTLDHARMVGDIETLDFSSDLVGILRQLVGVDLLRENEIFFLPQPGESYRRKRHGKSKLYAARPSSGDLATSLVFQNVASSPREPKPPLSPSMVQAPASVAGSASTSAGSTGLKGRKSDRHSPSTTSHSDDEMTMREGDGASKRRKGPSAKRNGVASSEEMPPPRSDPQSKHASAQHHTKARRSKRLSIDAHAYKPEDEVEEASTDQDSNATKGRRKKTGKRGIKRNRTSEFVEAEAGPEQPMAKRPRGRPSTSSRTAGDERI